MKLTHRQLEAHFGEIKTAHELILARDDAVRACTDLKAFFDARFVESRGATNSNPENLPTLVGFWHSELVAQQIRETGAEIQNQIKYLELVIYTITREIITRSTK